MFKQVFNQTLIIGFLCGIACGAAIPLCTAIVFGSVPVWIIELVAVLCWLAAIYLFQDLFNELH
jgi:hypothetical protein